MKLTFLGVGSAFTMPKDGSCDWQSNMVLESASGKKLLIDCGTDIRFSLAEAKIDLNQIDGVYISHLHADHIGGLEYLAFCRYFQPNPVRPLLLCNKNVMTELWESSLKGGLFSIPGKVVTLTEFFECCPIVDNDFFIWDNLYIQPIQTVHVVSGYSIKYSYGLLVTPIQRASLVEAKLVLAHIKEKVNQRRVKLLLKDDLQKSSVLYFNLNSAKSIFITTDTQFCPHQIKQHYTSSAAIFHDCETSPFKSDVHAHYSDLVTLSPDIKKKMYLYHYQPNPEQDAVKDGFKGFVKKGQVFEF